jgi:hypothetical protein
MPSAGRDAVFDAPHAPLLAALLAASLVAAAGGLAAPDSRGPGLSSVCALVSVNAASRSHLGEDLGYLLRPPGQASSLNAAVPIFDKAPGRTYASLEPVPAAAPSITTSGQTWWWYRGIHEARTESMTLGESSLTLTNCG